MGPRIILKQFKKDKYISSLNGKNVRRRFIYDIANTIILLIYFWRQSTWQNGLSTGMLP